MISRCDSTPVPPPPIPMESSPRNTLNLTFWPSFPSSTNSPNSPHQIRFPPVPRHVRFGSRQFFLILWGQSKIECLQNKLFRSILQLHRLVDQASDVNSRVVGLTPLLLVGRLKSMFLTEFLFLPVKGRKKNISISQLGQVDDRRLRDPLGNMGDHPTSFLEAVCPL